MTVRAKKRSTPRGYKIAAALAFLVLGGSEFGCGLEINRFPGSHEDLFRRPALSQRDHHKNEDGLLANSDKVPSQDHHTSHINLVAADVGDYPDCEIQDRTYCLDIKSYPEAKIRFLLENYVFDIQNLILSEGTPAFNIGSLHNQSIPSHKQQTWQTRSKPSWILGDTSQYKQASIQAPLPLEPHGIQSRALDNQPSFAPNSEESNFQLRNHQMQHHLINDLKGMEKRELPPVFGYQEDLGGSDDQEVSPDNFQETVVNPKTGQGKSSLFEELSSQFSKGNYGQESLFTQLLDAYKVNKRSNNTITLQEYEAPEPEGLRQEANPYHYPSKPYNTEGSQIISQVPSAFYEPPSTAKDLNFNQFYSVSQQLSDPFQGAVAAAEKPQETKFANSGITRELLSTSEGWGQKSDETFQKFVENWNKIYPREASEGVLLDTLFRKDDGSSNNLVSAEAAPSPSPIGQHPMPQVLLGDRSNVHASSPSIEWSSASSPRSPASSKHVPTLTALDDEGNVLSLEGAQQLPSYPTTSSGFPSFFNQDQVDQSFSSFFSKLEEPINGDLKIQQSPQHQKLPPNFSRKQDNSDQLNEPPNSPERVESNQADLFSDVEIVYDDGDDGEPSFGEDNQLLDSSEVGPKEPHTEVADVREIDRKEFYNDDLEDPVKTLTGQIRPKEDLQKPTSYPEYPQFRVHKPAAPVSKPPFSLALASQKAPGGDKEPFIDLKEFPNFKSVDPPKIWDKDGASQRTLEPKINQPEKTKQKTSFAREALSPEEFFEANKIYDVKANHDYTSPGSPAGLQSSFRSPGSESDFTPVHNPPPEFFQLKPVQKGIPSAGSKLAPPVQVDEHVPELLQPPIGVTTSPIESKPKETVPIAAPQGNFLRLTQNSAASVSPNLSRPPTGAAPLPPVNFHQRKDPKGWQSHPIRPGALLQAFSLRSIFPLKSGPSHPSRQKAPFKRQPDLRIDQNPFQRRVQSRAKRESPGKDTQLGDPKPACPVEQSFVHPRVAFSVKGQWLYLVNMPGHEKQQQGILVERCLTSTCLTCLDGLEGRNQMDSQEQNQSRCEPGFVQKRLVALHPSGSRLFTELFWFPSTCTCKLFF